MCCFCFFFFAMKVLRAHLQQHVGEVAIREFEVTLVVKF